MADTNQIYTTGQNGIIIGNCNGTSSNKLSVKKREHDAPPDGGARAIVVMISAFLCNSILFGIINTYGTVYLTLQQNLESEGDPEASSKAGEPFFLLRPQTNKGSNAESLLTKVFRFKEQLAGVH